MKAYFKLLAILLITITFVGCKTENTDKELVKREQVFWYTSPAEDWDNALPIGNGRLGAMVFGNPINERIQLNEDSMWPGSDEWGNSKGTPEDLAEIRNLIKTGQVHLADSLIVERFSYKQVARSHQTMGDLFINFEDKKVENYTRKLNLSEAFVESNYDVDSYNVSQKIFSSAADDVLVVKISTTNPEGLNYDLKLSRPDDNGHKTVEVTTPNENTIKMNGMVTQYAGAVHSKPVEIDHGVKFETVLQVQNDSGTINNIEGGLSLKNVKDATIYIVCNTSFYTQDFKLKNIETLQKVNNSSYKEILKNHIEDYQRLYNRTSINLGNHELDSLPTNERLKRVKEGKEDINFAAKLFDYGRYLLISSSRPNTNPANLQGIWNKDIQAPWNADYHLNINLQMNYWLADVTNLSECHKPLFDLTDRLIERSKILAKEQYGMRGAISHHTTDLWGTPWMRAVKPYWGSWIHGGGWIAQHYWEHYRFTQDTVFLKERAYPAIKAYAEFYADWLVLDERDNTLVSVPETSPENSYLAADGKPAAVSYGNAMGHQIIREVFDNVLESASILGIEDAFTKSIREKRSNLHSGIKIGQDGRLMEWDRAYEEPEKGHRHISHLYALHPGDDITIKNPELFEAAKKTIQYRLDNGGAGPGWSRAWIINFFARLLDVNAVEEHIDLFLQRSVYGNLLDIHPPFQIDGNFGFTSGIAEALLQSHEGFLRILPALPNNWKNGNIKGLKARGNILVDISWKDGRLDQLVLKSPVKKTIKLVYGNIEKTIVLEANKSTTLNNILKE
ncbi:glycoside hydrolase family 95 protein [Flaviramulus sp. BrNp1-15]|uniref:glycoside hydrolase family 95 protein n=1 Tax=Flaviramulus sp. BrNp1-15 TaxID=2916754 RepID=UPI001EE8AB07|nr:glycoside hydrolase family 95 protein [Flaviramulus sp. BrNp1-15]ULC58049.1 glycoside hydrolase family 95 protein [Flaviramulus sp. BrNp1-15]